MASSSGRDRQPDALSRLRPFPAPWPLGVAAPVDTPVTDDRVDDTSTRPPERQWGPTPPPRWLEEGAPEFDTDLGHPDRSEPSRPSTTARRLPFVAPPAAIALIAVGLIACVVTVYTVFRGPGDDSPAAARVAFPASAGPAASATASSSPEASGRTAPTPQSSGRPPAVTTELIVSVVGLVRSPGLVRLPGTGRVADAIARAGGGRPGADLLSLNMAQPVRDGDQILVGFADPAGGRGMRSAIVSASSSDTAAPSGPVPRASGASGPSAGAPVNLNTADEVALDTLPGVGPITAKAIIDWRTRNGGFTSVDQLAEVDGIGPGRLAKLRDRVTV